jgi:CubicO group peptidase (beta-lactamase class C family)
MRDLILVAFSFLCVLTHSGVTPATAQEQHSRTSYSLAEATGLLETWLQTILDYDRLPGLSLAVIHDQEIAYARGLGDADIDAAIPATPETRYGICSISKLFTAIAIMQLRDAGRLRLEDPVSRHLPWFAPQSPDPASPLPTIADLLRHTGGLPCEPDQRRWTGTARLKLTQEELIARSRRTAMSYPPNTQFNYSNLGYALLGAVISRLAGLSYEDYVAQEILTPLEMAATVPAGASVGHDVRLAKAYGRWPRNGDREALSDEADMDLAMTPAGGYVSTLQDLARFVMWQFRVLDGEAAGVLTEATLREMQTLQWPDPSWGYGFAIWHLGGKRIVGHQGGCPGYKAQIILCPEDRIAVVALLNATGAPQWTIAVETYRVLAPALMSSGTPSATPPGDQWADYVGHYAADRAWSDAEVIAWEGGLALLWVPSHSPLDGLIRLDPLGEGAFRQANADGSLGKHVVFGRDQAGHVIGMKFNNNVLLRAAR